MIGIREAKNALRQSVKAAISSLSESQKKIQSDIVLQKLTSMHQWRSCQNISIYLSMPSEVSTLKLLEQGFRDKKVIFVPRYTKSNMEMVEIYSMDDFNSLPETSWKIKQPLVDDYARKIPTVDNGGLDLIIVPGLAFTEGGYRLGRGKGYYDKYLHEYRNKFNKLPYLISPAFNEQIVNEIPATDLDMKVDAVIYANSNH